MMQPDPVNALSSQLRRVRARWLRAAALGAFARTMIAAAVVLALAAGAGRAVRESDAAALMLALAAVAAVAGLAAAAAWPFRRRPDDRRVARFVEERCPECADAIVTAVDITERGAGTRDFAPMVVASAVRQLAAIDLDRIVDRRETRGAVLRAAGAAGACVLGLVVAAPLFERAAQTAYIRIFPASVTLSVAPGDMRVAAGRPATILATVSSRAGRLDRLTARITLDAGGQTVTLPMERTAEGYRFQVPSVERSFHYLVSAGPAASRAYAVTALHPARVRRIDLQYDFPSFTGLPPRLDRDGGDVFGPAGTRVRVIVHADKPVREGTLAFSQGQPSTPLTRVDDRTFAAPLTVSREGAYRVGLVDPDGLTSESVEYFVRVMDDRPPDVHILRPGGDEGITPLQEVPIEVRADDDFGIEKMDLVFSVGGGGERVVPFTSHSGTTLARIGARMLAAEDLKVKPGDVIAYYARAWDVPRAKRSTMARSEIFFLEVKPFNEEYSLAQSQAGMQAATATQLDGLISAQKEIISATWNLERRSTTGRSASDVKGVADAQAELKGRAERAAGAQQQRRRFGQQPPGLAVGSGAAPPAVASQPALPPQAGGDPVQQAVQAMGRAAQELQNEKTAGAIPHEMAALNALLQAQAEIRRREVAQQQGNGGGAWGNRQTQDLSTLFDRELKRQQKTNYEDKAQIETQPETQPSTSALDKIRDLARRQEELTRRQQELAKSGLSAEELKRRLETLTREQEELRRQLQDAARQMQQAQGQQGAQGARGAQGASGAAGAEGAQEAVRDALQQMRDAAEQGQRTDAASAASKGQQAADALRRAEARMEGGSPDAQKRALGDLQLESQQVVKEQERIADEAERLDREGGGTSDARRRLAGEKERLAERVDALQQSAQRLPAAGDAARDLAAQQIGGRMRSTAKQLREGQPGARSGQAERQIADALDRIARKMGSADAGGATRDTKADTRQLANDLDEVRDARDRVARLEREMRDTQRAAATQGPRGESGKASGGAAPTDANGTQGSRGAQGAQAGDVAQLQQQLNEEMQRTRDLLGRMQGGGSQSGGGGTPERHEWSRSAPGTESFKQDYAAWQSLTADVARALERAESSAASRLSAALARDRLRAGGSERVPDAYRRQVSRYFESIAVKKRP